MQEYQTSDNAPLSRPLSQDPEVEHRDRMGLFLTLTVLCWFLLACIYFSFRFIDPFGYLINLGRNIGKVISVASCVFFLLAALKVRNTQYRPLIVALAVVMCLLRVGFLVWSWVD